MAVQQTPSTLNAGLTNTWTLTLPEYPASEGWYVVYALRSAGKDPINFNSSADGDLHKVYVAPDDAEEWEAGSYAFGCYVTDGVDRYSVENGTVVINPFMSEQTESFDGRTKAQRIVDALKASIEGLASAEIDSTSINGKSVQRMGIKEKQDALVFWQNQVALEQRRASKKILVNFIPNS